MKKGLNIKLSCKACNDNYMLDNNWINDSGFIVKQPVKNVKITNIIGEKKKINSSKTVSLF